MATDVPVGAGSGATEGLRRAWIAAIKAFFGLLGGGGPPSFFFLFAAICAFKAAIGFSLRSAFDGDAAVACAPGGGGGGGAPADKSGEGVMPHIVFENNNCDVIKRGSQN